MEAAVLGGVERCIIAKGIFLLNIGFYKEGCVEQSTNG